MPTGLWDPEGVLSTILRAIGTTCLFGMVARNEILRERRRDDASAAPCWGCSRARQWRWSIIGYVWSWFFPINKPIWTSSYAVFTAGQAMCALALCLLDH